MWAAKSVSGVALPFTASASLDRFGSSTTLRAWTVVTFVKTVLSLPFMKPRIPVSPSASPRRLDLRFLKLSSFWVLQTGNIIQGFGYFLPSTYLPSYSTTTVPMGTMLIALFSGTSIFGGIVIGWLCDRFAINNVLLFSSVGSALSVFLFWGLASAGQSSPNTALTLLTLFSVSYGFFAGGFSSTWSGVITHIKRDSSSSSMDTGFVFGLLAGGRGVGNVLGSVGAARAHEATGYGTRYGTLIIFTGVTALFGA
ncbi:hypothetical protein N7468_005626 [Penicillium chermesinum]|uniref:Major facilitator superfamily (MFS) profile domain-containing protein n=1 Tax=Penicillium chermesinum TaxID=63820 RepID=A0A9W9NZS2_9EURO|nr:uncharacterized protein N7468_005626 [Penicillium chermesinum]KAJ5232670.1 hypothetical protein N7468_005626 [Penicillium chermesinum]KAJ6172329.1 hypothetical protein N7470_001396 [Penicillium chermesinum]